MLASQYYLKALEKDKHHADSLGNLGKIYSDRAEREGEALFFEKVHSTIVATYTRTHTP